MDELIFNVLALSCNLYGLFTIQEEGPDMGYGGQFQFLTILGLTTSTLAMTFKLARYISPSLFQGPYMILSNLATPVEGLISVLYWSIVLYDRDLLVPKDIAFQLPLSLDLALHLWPTLFLYFDLFVYKPGFKRSLSDIACLMSFAVGYFFWTRHCFTKNNFYPYPFLAFFTDPQRLVFFCICGALASVMYLGGAYAHSLYHMNNTKSKKL
ncbi:FAR-17a/AIG1-like protein [Chlamydoabsidia padenii]|nr:FAR-17a/AIG1-like protein [Chlamydoabsidia padenii]